MANLNAADYAIGFNTAIEGWAPATGSAALRVIGLATPTQNAFVTQTTANLCVFYNTTSITTPVARVGFTLPGNFSSIQNQKGCALIDGATSNGYTLEHNGGNPGTIELKIIVGMVRGAAIASVAATTGVIDDSFYMDRNAATGEMKVYQRSDAGAPVLKLTHTDNTIPNANKPALISIGSSANVISLLYEAVGGSVTSITNPIVLGSAIAVATTGFSTVTSVTALGMAATSVVFTAGAVTANWPALADGQVITAALPATGVTVTVSDGSNPATIVSNINLASGDTYVPFGTVITDDPHSLGSVYTINSGWRAYYPTANGLVISPDGIVEVNSAGAYVIFIHKLGSGDATERLTVNIAEDGTVIAPPVMPADTSVSVYAGATVLGTFAAISGTEPITYTRGGVSAALFTINSSTATVSFIAPAVLGASGSITVTGTNADSSDTMTITFSVIAVPADDSRNLTAKALTMTGLTMRPLTAKSL